MEGCQAFTVSGRSGRLPRAPNEDVMIMRFFLLRFYILFVVQFIVLLVFIVFFFYFCAFAFQGRPATEIT